MVVVGVDPGLAHTGWGVIELCASAPHMRAHAYGCIETHADEPLQERLGTICAELSRVIMRYHPQALAIEDIFFGRNSRSAILTAHARGAALVAAAQCGLEVASYTPMQIKQAVVGTGAADKRQVSYMVRAILALDHTPTPDHAADALAAAICHANLAHTFAGASARSAQDGRSLARAQRGLVASSEHDRR